MSAADRDYWRESDPAGPRLTFDLPPVTRVLFFALIGCFIAQALNDVYGQNQVINYVALTRTGVAKGWLWQLLTFQFLHGGLLHLAGNLLGLWSFGGTVERILGSTRYLLAYLGAGVVGGLLQAILMSSFPNHFAPVVLGASAGVAGLFATFALLHRDTIFLIFFVVPVSALSLYYALAAISLFFTLVPSSLGGIAAHAAHLGGMMFGTLWVRQGWHHDYQPLPGQELWARWFRQKTGSPKKAPLDRTTVAPNVLPSITDATVRTGEGARGKVDLSAEVDPILDKITKHGIQSLTVAEREKLDSVRRKMSGS